MIYLDLDDLLADHRSALYEKAGIHHWTAITPEKLKVYKTKNFFSDLEKTSICDQLLSFVQNVFGEYNIITSPNKNAPHSCMRQKIKWIRKNLKLQPSSIIFTHDKSQFALGNILIDDFGQNVKKWNEAGGTAFKFKNGSKNYSLEDLFWKIYWHDFTHIAENVWEKIIERSI